MKWLAPILLATSAFAGSDDISGWRMKHDGLYHGENPPTEWSAEKNVLWKTKTPDFGNAHVVMVGKRLFITSEPDSLICLNVKDGKIMWSHTNSYSDAVGKDAYEKQRAAVADQIKPLNAKLESLAEETETLREGFDDVKDDEARKEMRNKFQELRKESAQLRKDIAAIDPYTLPDTHNDNGYASPVPVSDGKHVYAVFGTGVVSGFTIKGKRLWTKIVARPKHHFGHGSSPALSGDTLVVQFEEDLFALDKTTGAERWRVNTQHSFGSPIILKIGGEPLAVSAGGDVVRVSDGAKLAENIGNLTYATPFAHEGVLYFIQNDARAVKMPAKAEPGMPFEPLWEARIKGSRHYASSLVFGDLLYAVSRERMLTVLDKKTGELIYEKRLEIEGDNHNSVYASLCMAGGLLYVGFEEGTTLLIKPGKDYQEVTRNNLERYRGTPFFHQDRIYIRGLEHVYCLGKK